RAGLDDRLPGGPAVAGTARGAWRLGGGHRLYLPVGTEPYPSIRNASSFSGGASPTLCSARELRPLALPGRRSSRALGALLEERGGDSEGGHDDGFGVEAENHDAEGAEDDGQRERRGDRHSRRALGGLDVHALGDEEVIEEG